MFKNTVGWNFVAVINVACTLMSHCTPLVMLMSHCNKMSHIVRMSQSLLSHKLGEGEGAGLGEGEGARLG